MNLGIVCNLVLGIWIFLFIFLARTKPAYGQQISLSLSPPLLEVIIKPGKSITQVYKITNDGDPTIVVPKFAELTENGISNNPNFVPEKWISVVNSDLDFDKPFLLKAKETRQLILRVSPSAGTAEKDYYRAVYFTTKPNPVLDTSQSSISQNIASPLVITVTATGLLAKGAQITGFDVPRILDSFDPLTAQIFVKNAGNNFFRPIGKISLTGSIGRAGFDIVPNIILSGQTRQLFTENTPETGDGQPTLKLPGFFLGKYVLEVDFTLDQGAIRITQSKTFYAFPWKISIIIIPAVLITIKFIKRKKKVKR